MKDQIMTFVNLLLPALWATAGPAFVVMLTATANNLAKLYIPRAIQIPLAGILGAIVAGLTGDQSASAAAVGLADGLAVQAALSMSPAKFLASAKGAVPMLLTVTGMALLATACTSVAELGGNRYAVPASAEVRSPFGSNVVYSRLDDCEGYYEEPGGVTRQYRDCKPIHGWSTPMATQGQGGQVMSGALTGLGFGIGSAFSGAGSATSSASSSATATAVGKSSSGH